MEVQTWDSVFIRATRRQLHPVIADVAGWARWWPGMTVVAGPQRFELALKAPGPLARGRRWSARLVNERPGLGIQLRYDGVVAGDAEFYYLDERAGTVVHYVLRGRVDDRRWHAAVRWHRAGVRAGLNALKDRFEAHRTPGDEPEGQLLAHQQQALADFAAGVAAGKRTPAAGTAAPPPP